MRKRNITTIFRDNPIMVVPQDKVKFTDDMINEIKNNLSGYISNMVEKYRSFGLDIPLPAILIALNAITMDQLMMASGNDMENECVKKVHRELLSSMEDRSNGDMIMELLGTNIHLINIYQSWLKGLE